MDYDVDYDDEYDDDERVPTMALVLADFRAVLARPVTLRAARTRRWVGRVRGMTIDWGGFAVTRGGFFEWFRPSEYEPWPNGRQPERVPMLVASGGFCAPSAPYYGESGWQQWAEWYCAHSWKLVDAFPPLSVERGAVRYVS